MSRKAYSLLELMTVTLLSLLLVVVSMPLFNKSLQETHFLVFASELLGHLNMARQYALISGEPVQIEFHEQGAIRYTCSIPDGNGGRRLLAEASLGSGYHRTIRLRLPPFPLSHPSSGRPLEKAIGSTHGNKIIFAARGASSATLLFSDGVTRNLCVVVASRTGRFRVYYTEAGWSRWESFF